METLLILLKRGTEQYDSVGIDVSKDKSMVSIMKPGGEALAPPYEIYHTLNGTESLIEQINSCNEEVRVVLESTGHYHWSLVTLCIDNGIFVCCVNALRMKRYCSQSLRKAKTDKIDAIKIASYGIAFWQELVPVEKGLDTYDELRLSSRQYYQYSVSQ